MDQRAVAALLFYLLTLSGVHAGTRASCGWTAKVDPYRGWVASIAFHPSEQNTIILSGDDSAGVFSSFNGGSTWTVASQPPDQSSYSLVIDPLVSGRVYAPNRFGRGVIRSNDTGQTYSYTAAAGLPKFQGANSQINTAVVLSDNTLVLGLGGNQGGGGLFASTDGGSTFTKIQSGVFLHSDFSAAAYGILGTTNYLIAGTAKGYIYSSSNGTFGPWTSVLPSPGGTVVTSIAISKAAAYVIFADSTILRIVPPFTAPQIQLLNQNGNISIGSLFYHLALAPNNLTDPNTDVVYVGTTIQTSGAVDTRRYGIHRITTTGALLSPTINIVQLTNGIEGVSIFNLAVDPFNSQHIVAGTLGNGAVATSNGGNSWTMLNTSVLTPALGFAQDPQDTNHLMVAATDGIAGTPSLYESQDGGITWINQDNTIPLQPAFDTRALAILPATSTALNSPQLGQYGYPGIWRKAQGDTLWKPALLHAIAFDRFVINENPTTNTTTVYAVSPTLYNCSTVTCLGGAVTAPLTDYGLWKSTDDGQTWSTTPPTVHKVFTDLSVHPQQATHPGEMIAAAYNDDVYASTDGFTSVFTPLKLSALLPSPPLTAVALLPQDPKIILAATAVGTLYKGTNYGASGEGMQWREVAVPVSNTSFRYILPINTPSGWVVMASLFAGDLLSLPNPTEEVILSEDDGDTWTFDSTGLFPSNIIWSIHAAMGNSQDKAFAANWGGGLYKWQCTTGGTSSAASTISSFAILTLLRKEK